MASNPFTLTIKYPLLSQFLDMSGKPISHFGTQTRIPTNPIQISGLRSRSEIGFRHLSFDPFRVWSIADNGSGGSNGGYGGSGGGNGDSGGGGESDWSLLSWYLTLLENYPVRTKAVTSAFLNFLGDIICQVSSSKPSIFVGLRKAINLTSLVSIVYTISLIPIWLVLDNHINSSPGNPSVPVMSVTFCSYAFPMSNFFILGVLFYFMYMIDQVESLDLKRAFLFTLLGLVLVGPTLHFWYSYLSKLVAIPGAAGAFLRLLLDQFVFTPIFAGVFLSTLVTLEGRPSQVIPKLEQEWFSTLLANWQLWIPFQFLNFRFVPQQFQVLAANCIALVWNVILSYKAHKEVVAK